MDRALLIALCCAGCLRDTTFHCTDDSQCGDNGACESTLGLCTFPDSSCANGRRFGQLGGSQANQCVGNCTGYSSVPGQAHLYRKASQASWDDQQSGCTTDGGYLVVPDDMDELTAVLSFAGGDTIWVGVDDEVLDGDFVTVLGAQATFLPWATGEPNDMGGGGGSGARCVQAQNDGFHDFRCGDNQPAVCECEP